MSTSTTAPQPTKTVQRLLDRHAKLRDEFRDAFAAVETSDEKLDSPAGKKLVAARDRAGDRLREVAEKLRAQGYTLEHDDSQPVPPAPQGQDKTGPRTTNGERAAVKTRQATDEERQPGATIEVGKAKDEATVPPKKSTPAKKQGEAKKTTPEPKPAPDPVPLTKVTKKDTVHIYREGRKGYLVAENCRVVADGKELAFKCRWHKDEVTIPIADLTGMTVKRERAYVPVALS